MVRYRVIIGPKGEKLHQARPCAALGLPVGAGEAEGLAHGLYGPTLWFPLPPCLICDVDVFYKGYWYARADMQNAPLFLHHA
jgi:hypothetical protein